MLREINIVGVPPRDGMYTTTPGADYNPVLNLVTRILNKVKLDEYWSEIAHEDLSFYIAERSNVPISQENLLPRLTPCRNEREVVDELLEIGFRLAPIPLSLSVHQFQSSREEYIGFIVPKIFPPQVKESQKATEAIVAANKQIRERLMWHYLLLAETRSEHKEKIDEIESSMNTVTSLLDRNQIFPPHIKGLQQATEANFTARKERRERLMRNYIVLAKKRREHKGKIDEIESFMDSLKALVDSHEENEQDLEEVARMKLEDNTGLPGLLVKPMRLRLRCLEEQKPEGLKESTLTDGRQSDGESDNSTGEDVQRPKKKARG
jgi:hypothetical protein